MAKKEEIILFHTLMVARGTWRRKLIDPRHITQSKPNDQSLPITLTTWFVWNQAVTGTAFAAPVFGNPDAPART